MEIDSDKTHDCECNRSWKGIEFESAVLRSDGSSPFRTDAEYFRLRPAYTRFWPTRAD
jgi:hypothetical protein